MSKYSMATRPSTELRAKPVASGKQRTQRVWNLSELSRSCSGRPASSLHARQAHTLMVDLINCLDQLTPL